ncbi:hypothetical protein RLIN73S_03898 [Rhodanobacter lindaniclasticus]
MRYPAFKLAALTAIFFACASSPQAAPACEVSRPVNFSGASWESNLVLVEVQRFILENGYGCKTEVLPTETLPALAALERGDLDVNTEIWLNSVAEPWKRAEATGKVKRVGELYLGARAGSFPATPPSACPS